MFQIVSKSSKSSKKLQKFYCKNCDYSTSRKNNYNKHLASKKHKKNLFQIVSKSSKSSKKVAKKEIVNNYVCEFCDKTYNSRTSLWRHKKQCEIKFEDNVGKDIEKDDNIELKKIVMELHESHKKMNQYNEKMIEKKDKLIEKQFKIIEDLSKNPKQIINNTQNISINVFLNDYCKNAMNLTDFVDNLKVTLEDMHRTNQLGLTDGITNIFLEGLNDLSELERPIHCVDKKRGKFYIKDENIWKKDDNDKIKGAMHNVKIKHIKKLKDWEDKHPNFNIPGHSNNESWSKLVDTVTKDVDDKDQKKLLKKIQDSVMFKDTIKNIECLKENV